MNMSYDLIQYKGLDETEHTIQKCINVWMFPHEDVNVCGGLTWYGLHACAGVLTTHILTDLCC